MKPKIINYNRIKNLRKSDFKGRDVIMYEESNTGITVIVYDQVNIYNNGRLLKLRPDDFDRRVSKLNTDQN